MQYPLLICEQLFGIHGNGHHHAPGHTGELDIAQTGNIFSSASIPEASRQAKIELAGTNEPTMPSNQGMYKKCEARQTRSVHVCSGR
jgi:hypothetical protein